MAGKSVMLIAVAAVVAVVAGAVVFPGDMDNGGTDNGGTDNGGTDNGGTDNGDEGTVTLKYRDPVVGDTFTTTSIQKDTNSDGTTYTKTVSQSTLKSIEDGKYVIVEEDTISTSTDGKNYIVSRTDTREGSVDTYGCLNDTGMNDLIAGYIDSIVGGATKISSVGTVSYFGATLAKESVFLKTYYGGALTSVVKMSTEFSNISTPWGEVSTNMLNIDVTMSDSANMATGHYVIKLFCYDFDGEAYPMKGTIDGDTSLRQSGVVNNISTSFVSTLDAWSNLSKA